MTPLVRQTLAKAGLLDMLEARARGEVPTREDIPRGVDLLALGAFADAVRSAEVGAVVHVYADSRVPEGAFEASRELRGLDLLREVATVRVTSPRGARVRVDWGAASLEIAQAALGFGASELSGPIANRRGLPIADDAAKKVKGQGMVSLQLLQKREIERLLRAAGRQPLFDAEIAALEDHASQEEEETLIHG